MFWVNLTCNLTYFNLLLTAFYHLYYTQTKVKYKDRYIINHQHTVTVNFYMICSGRINRRFIPVSKILKPVLNEYVTPVTCCWCLSLLIRNENELTLVFKVITIRRLYIHYQYVHVIMWMFGWPSHTLPDYYNFKQQTHIRPPSLTTSLNIACSDYSILHNHFQKGNLKDF